MTLKVGDKFKNRFTGKVYNVKCDCFADSSSYYIENDCGDRDFTSLNCKTITYLEQKIKELNGLIVSI